MTGFALIGLAIAAVAVLLALVIWGRVPAFIALIMVSVATAIISGIPLAEAVSTVTDGIGNTLGSVIVVVGLGAMLGRLIEVSGGAQSVAQYFTDKLGRAKVAAAVSIAAFILGIPVFFDVGFIILAPLIFGFAAVAGINPLRLGLPIAGILMVVHVALPPHPGPVSVAELMGGDPGLMLTVGLPIGAVTATIGFLVARFYKVDGVQRDKSPAEATPLEDNASAPGPYLVMGLILLPIILIMGGTTGAMVLEDGTAKDFLGFIGASPIALLIAVVVAWFVLGMNQKWSLEKSSGIIESALPTVAVIIFVTGAGGGFANVLVESGIGDELSTTLTEAGLSIFVTAYLLALALRAAQGSATVAMLTTAGLLATPAAAAGLSSIELTMVMLAVGFGALGLSHINDSGFWIVTKYLGLSVKQGIMYWTTLSTIFSVTGFIITGAVYALV